MNNLEILASYLEGNLRSEFCMDHFGDDDYDIDCGTSGCAVGHGPYAGIPKLPTENWIQYCERVFGVIFDTPAFKWLFSPHWSMMDNSADGAAKRIRYFLAHGVPRNYMEQLVGRSDLCY